MRGLRLAVSTLAIYGLILQAFLGGAAMSASFVASAGGETIICQGIGQASNGQLRHIGDGSDKTQQAHSQNCACQGLCAQHGSFGLDHAVDAVGLVPARLASRLAGPRATAVTMPRSARQWGFARAPPRSGSPIA
jgi:hypothetical protein